MIPCEHAQTSLSQDNQGKAWEHFWLGDRYQFSNQIPNLKSFTRTDPGWVLADNRYCNWQSQPPARMRESAPMVAQQMITAESAIAPITADVGMTSGGFGLLVLVAAAVGGVMWWQNRDKTPDPNYHPMADMPYQLPSLPVARVESLPDELEWQEGEPIPEGYELVEEEGEAEEPGEENNFPKVTVPSPFLPQALKEQIRNEAQDAARHQAHTALMQGMHLAERIYPRSLRTSPGASRSSVSLAPPAVEGVEPLVGQPVVGLVEPPVERSVEPDPKEVELFEETVSIFCPLALDPHDGATQEAVREALRLGKSQNWITSTLFQVSKNTRDYDRAVGIVKAMKEATHG
ncbi:hypothetical protein [Pseudanabaena sp. FACHB-2040]|uniref:hypothetical protein n=1 Tax=Pseudanabaena sp. FACHB-2040 TaxID=2692859 RepID=UPI0016888E65|nr:hypothetical protein [Pseudanabaena sp. FACHB-2040]MBD2261154.1 hypothetical protein [Pseudanabaena sp. FACHB-2040]